MSQPDPQVLYQSFSNQIIQAHYQYFYHSQLHLEIQVNHVKTIPQGCHLCFFQFILLVILDLHHHMYQVRIHTELQINNRSGLYKKKGGQHLNKLNTWKNIIASQEINVDEAYKLRGLYIIKLKHGN